MRVIQSFSNWYLIGKNTSGIDEVMDTNIQIYVKRKNIEQFGNQATFLWSTLKVRVL